MSDATTMAAARLLTAAKEALAAQMSKRSRTSLLLQSAIAQYERSLEIDEKMAEDEAERQMRDQESETPMISLELLRERGLL